MDEYGVAKSPVGSMLQEIQALEDYGHDCCAHVDDRIHEHCKRIKDAYSNDVWTYQLALSRMESQEMLATYDVLGNERHEAVLELKKLHFAHEGEDFSDSLPPEMNLMDLIQLISCFCDPEGDWPNTFATARDALIHLLGGDQSPVKLGDLFGILKEDKDGVDTGRCDKADSDTPDAPAAERAGDCVHHQCIQGLAPITQELREKIAEYKPTEDGIYMQTHPVGTIGYERMVELCDQIDAVHESLERENKELQNALDDAGLERALSNMHAAGSEREKLMNDFAYETGVMLTRIHSLEEEVKRAQSEAKTQRNNFDQATSARQHWKDLYESALEQIHDLEHDVEMWRDRAEDMRMERDDALHEHHDFAPESHYIMLPKDADGMPIHIGDLMEFTVGDPSKFVVDTLSYSDGIWAVDGDSPSTMRHAADSIEQIITDAINVHSASGFNPCWDIERDELVSRAKSLIGSS